MKKTIILYFSQHHGNTKKLVDAIGKCAVKTVEISKAGDIDLSEYDLIGIASGIYGGNYGKPVLKYVSEHLPEGKDVFLLYSYAKKLKDYTGGIRKVIEEKKGKVVTIRGPGTPAEQRDGSVRSATAELQNRP